MTIQFETYPPFYNNYETGEFNENYDNELVVFTVPTDWCERWVKRNRNMELYDFLQEYTWDDTEAMLNDASIADVILSEERVPRDTWHREA